MKVLHAAETIKGGVATVMMQLAESQERNPGITELKLLVPDSQVGELHNVIDLNSILPFKRKKRNLLSMITFFYVFTKTVFIMKPDIIHLHSSFAGILGRISISLLRPFIYSKVVYCPHAFSFLMTSSKLKKKTYICVEKVLQPFADKIICVSEYEKKMAIKSGLKENNLYVIYNGVPIKKLKAKPLVKSKTIKLLFVGRFDYQKGYDILLDAFQKLQNKKYLLTIVGESVRETIISKINHDSITYTGWLKGEELERYFLESDILVIPSRWEGFAMVTLEAMSYGLPVIASNASSFPEQIENGVTGFLFESGDINDLIDKIDIISQKDYSLFGQKGNEKFLKEFTAEKMIDSTFMVYNEILSDTIVTL